MILKRLEFGRTVTTKALLLGVLVLSAAFLFQGTPAFSASDASFIQGSEKRVSIDLRDSELTDLLKFLAQKGGFNVFLSKQVQGRVTLYLQEVRIIDILDIVLLSNNLAHFNQADNIVYVMTQEEYKARFGEDYGDPRQVKWLRLKYAAPSQIFKMLEPTKSKIGSIVVDEQSGTLILMDTPEKMKFMMDVIHELDQPQLTKVFDLSYSKAEDVKTLLTTQANAQGVVSINSDTRSNQIIVTALTDRMKQIEDLVAKIDRKTREVTIDAQIIKVILSHDFHRGINWSQAFNKGILEPLNFTTALPSSTASAGSATLGTLSYSTNPTGGGSDAGVFDGVLRFLEVFGDTKVLANPRITLVEGEEAKILIGTRKPYATTTTTSGTTTTTSATINFVDVGISLNVSAVINKDGYVTMKVKPEVSSAATNLTVTTDVGVTNTIPIVDTTTAETRVMVKDGTTIVMGGMRKEEKILGRNQIPGFSKLPVIGDMFKNEDTELEQTELVVFLTPHIIGGDETDLYEQDRVGKSPRPYASWQASSEILKEKEGASDSPVAPKAPLAASAEVLEFKDLKAYPGKKG